MPCSPAAYRWGENWVFTSYGGNIYVVDVEGDTATLVDKIAVSEGVEGNWRPGGYQPITVRNDTGMAYLLMHSNGVEGSHKNPAEEIWAVDLKTKKVVGRAASVPAHRAFGQPGRRAGPLRHRRVEGRNRALRPSRRWPGFRADARGDRLRWRSARPGRGALMQAGFTLAHPIFIIVAAGTLVCVFLRGAAHKFFDFTWFSHILAEYRILPGDNCACRQPCC